MKKLILALMCLLLVFAFASCGLFGSTTDQNQSCEHIDENGDNLCDKCSEAIEIGIIYTVSEDGTYAIVTDYSSKETDVFISETYNGLPVTSIGDEAFKSCYNIKSVFIPDSVTTIGEYAFDYCPDLTDVYITNIAAWCNISFGNYASNPLYYAKNLYLNGELITELAIPDDVTQIPAYAFYKASNITSVVIPDSVTEIGSSAFGGCTELQSVTIGNGVTSIDRDAFSNCNPALYIEYEYGKYIGDESNPYAALIELTNKNFTTYTIHENTKHIASHVFHNNLTNITIPYGVISIGSSAFSFCSNLTSVVIPDSVTSIGSSAFRYCSNLTSVTIGNSVTSIGENAFDGCYDLTDIYITDIAAWCNISFDNYYSNPLYYAKNLYLNGELITDLVIPDGVTQIPAYAFYKASNITSVIIPDSVTTIGSSAFYYCSGLTSVVIGDSVTSIGSNAFSSCSGLTSVVIGDGVTTIGYDAFNYCLNLKDVYITDVAAWCNISFGDYDANPLHYDTNLYLNGELITELVIPDGVTTIPARAFYRQSSITSVVIPDSVTSIGSSAFDGCLGLTSVVIPDSVTTIDDGAFYDCTHLKTVYYVGDVNDWWKITIHSSNSAINYATRYFYSEDEPNQWGNFWHYAENGMISIWNKNIDSDNGDEPCQHRDADDNYLCDKCGENFNDGKDIEDKPVCSHKDANDDNLCDKCGASFSDGKDVPDDTEKEILYAISADGSYAYVRGYKGAVSNVVIAETYNDLPVTKIGTEAFAECKTLLSVSIPNSVTEICDGAFSQCINLNKINIPNSVVSIGNDAFYSCFKLSSIDIPDSVTSIGDGAFSECNFTSITIPDSVTSFGEWMFYLTVYIETAKIGNGVTSIGEATFCGCYFLKSVIVGNSVTSIGPDAFNDCESLTLIYYVGTENAWNNITIDYGNDCLELATIYFYSETEPTEEGNYWHYDENGEIAVW